MSNVFSFDMTPNDLYFIIGSAMAATGTDNICSDRQEQKNNMTDDCCLWSIFKGPFCHNVTSLVSEIQHQLSHLHVPLFLPDKMTTYLYGNHQPSHPPLNPPLSLPFCPLSVKAEATLLP